MLFRANPVNLLSDVKNTLGIVSRNGVQNIEAVHSDVDLRITEANQGVVKEDIEPLFVELFFISDQKGVASIHHLIVFQVLL